MKKKISEQPFHRHNFTTRKFITFHSEKQKKKNLISTPSYRP